MNQPHNESELTLFQHVRSWVGRAYYLYSLLALVAFVLTFYWYYSFSGNENIVFIQHQLCEDDFYDIVESEQLRGKAIIVYSHATIYPEGHVLYWHDNLRRLHEDDIFSDLAILYVNRWCSADSPLTAYRYRRFVRKNDLHGYHASPAFPDSLEDIRERSLVWFVSADRTRIVEDFWSITNYDDLREFILEQLSANQLR